MAQKEHVQDLRDRCRTSAERLLARYGSRLLTRDACVQLTLDAVQAGAASTPERAASHIYTLALHIACTGVELVPDDEPDAAHLYRAVAGHVVRSAGSPRARQELGYTELYRYLYAIAQWRYPELHEDVAQIALEQIYRTLAHCRVPGAFLKFAILRLADAARTLLRGEAQSVQSLDLPIDGGGDTITLGQLLADPGQRDPLDLAVNDSLRRQVARSMADCARRHPRARLQLAVVWMKYIEDMDDVTIGRRIKKSVASVQTARSRGLKLLAADPTFRALAAECGVGDLLELVQAPI